MNRIENSKQYNLEGRMLEFAKLVKEFVTGLKSTPVNIEDSK
jgi:hypothetical protein